MDEKEKRFSRKGAELREEKKAKDFFLEQSPDIFVAERRHQ